MKLERTLLYVSLALFVATIALVWITNGNGMVGNDLVRNPMQEESRNLKDGLRGGAVVAEVVPNTAAEKAGLSHGDIIVVVKGEPVRDASHLRIRFGVVRLGETVELRVLRDGRERTVSASSNRGRGDPNDGR